MYHKLDTSSWYYLDSEQYGYHDDRSYCNCCVCIYNPKDLQISISVGQSYGQWMIYFRLGSYVLYVGYYDTEAEAIAMQSKLTIVEVDIDDKFHFNAPEGYRVGLDIVAPGADNDPNYFDFQYQISMDFQNKSLRDICGNIPNCAMFTMQAVPDPVWNDSIGEWEVYPFDDSDFPNTISAYFGEPAYNKVVYGNKVLVDLTSDTVTAETLLQGRTAHAADGSLIVGTMTSGSVNVATITAKPTTTNTTFSISGLLGEPKAFMLQYTGNITLASTRYVMAMCGNKIQYGYKSGNNGYMNYSATNGSYTYSNGTLTLTASGNSGSFYNGGNYILTYIY